MAVSNKKFNYAVARFLHWVGLAVIGFNLLSGWRIDSFEPDVKRVLLMIHSGVGTVVFFLMLFRWWWRRTNKLYTPPRWWKRPSMLLQWVFYPLLVIQPILGVGVAAFAEYEVLGLAVIPFSSLAAADASLHAAILQIHTIMAWLLLALVAAHGLERWRMIFVDDPNPAGA